jgi:hypothetical protein
VLKFNFILQALFRPLNTFLRKGKDPDPDPYLWLMDPDPDPGGQKHADPADPDPDPLNCLERGELHVWLRLCIRI